MHEDWIFYNDLTKNDYGHWKLYCQTGKGNIEAHDVTRDRLGMHRADLIRQLEKLRECCNELGINLNDSPL